MGRVSGRREAEAGPFKSGKGVGYRVRQARARPSNTSIRVLLLNDRYTEVALKFLETTRVGEVKAGVYVDGEVVGLGFP